MIEISILRHGLTNSSSTCTSQAYLKQTFCCSYSDKMSEDTVMSGMAVILILIWSRCVLYTASFFFFWGFLPSPAYEAVWYQRMARLCFSAMYVRLAEMGHRHCVADLEEKYGMVNEFKSFLVHCLSKNTCSLKTWWHHLSNRGLFLLLSRSGVPKCFTVSLTFFFFF